MAFLGPCCKNVARMLQEKTTPMKPKNTVTVSAVLLDWVKNQGNGANYYRIRITYKRKSKFMRTDIRVFPSELDENKQPIDRALRHRIDEAVLEVEKKISAIDPTELELMTVDELVEEINKTDHEGKFALDFYEFADTVIEAKTGQPQKYYRTAVNSLKAYTKKEKMDISEISSSMMREWEAWLRAKYGNNARAVSAYTSAIAFIHNQAKLKYNNEETGKIRILDPFKYYKPPRQKPSKHRNIEIELIQKMIDMRSELTGRERLGVDVFLISFGLMGMNSPDLYSCQAPEKNVIIYNRTKTRSRRDDEAEMHVKIDKSIKYIVEEYAGTGGLAFDFCKRYTTYQILGENVNAGLRAFCKRIGHTGRVTLYSARHTWATTAYEVGVGKEIINDGLCHVDRDMKVTDIYIKKDWSVIWRANEKVLARFNWK